VRENGVLVKSGAVKVARDKPAGTGGVAMVSSAAGVPAAFAVPSGLTMESAPAQFAPVVITVPIASAEVTCSQV